MSSWVSARRTTTPSGRTTPHRSASCQNSARTRSSTAWKGHDGRPHCRDLHLVGEAVVDDGGEARPAPGGDEEVVVEQGDRRVAGGAPRRRVPKRCLGGRPRAEEVAGPEQLRAAPAGEGDLVRHDALQEERGERVRAADGDHLGRPPAAGQPAARRDQGLLGERKVLGREGGAQGGVDAQERDPRALRPRLVGLRR